MIDRFSGPYAWLSNFYPARVQWNGMRFTTVEHAYVAAKTPNEEAWIQIRLTPSPAKVKRMGYKYVLRENWLDLKIDVMTDLIRQKFNDQELQAKLLETGDWPLIEGNHWNDKFWGVCNGEGENHLGKILMAERKYRREELAWKR